MSIVVSLLCLIIIVILVRYVRRIENRRLYQLLEQFPSYRAYPLIGNLNMLYGSMNDLRSRLETIMQPYNRLLFWLGPIPCLFIKKFDDIKIILAQNHDRDTLELGNEWSGMGIINAKYNEWKKSRRILAPAFSAEMLSKYTKVFNEKSATLVDELKLVADSDKFIDVKDYIINLNLESIIENTVGISIRNTGEMRKLFYDALLESLQCLAQRFISVWLHSSFVHSLYLKITGKNKKIQLLRRLPTEIVKNKLHDLQHRMDEINNDSSTAMIDLLIRESLRETTFTETRITDELLHIIGAGTETTSLNVCFLMLMLAKHQEIQHKVYEEITQIVADNDDLTADHLINHLKYLEQCIKETSRMFSPVVMTSRRTDKEYPLHDNTVIPANLFVLVFIHLAGYDDDLFENSSTWDPEHFNDRAISQRPKGSSQLSFGYGPRSCIGAKYAMMAAKTQIVHILRRYHLSTNVENFSIKDCTMDLSTRSKIGYPIKFASRKKLQ